MIYSDKELKEIERRTLSIGLPILLASIIVFIINHITYNISFVNIITFIPYLIGIGYVFRSMTVYTDGM